MKLISFASQDRDDQSRATNFSRALMAEGFEGDFEERFASREVLATDNSIYRMRPLAVVFPRSSEDVRRVVLALKKNPEDRLSLTPRGGGTGTNGQSLNSGIILDTSRFLGHILAFNEEEGTVTVEPGVVLGQLNSFLNAAGFFFPPTVSTATRATLGGMVATDASGKGSRLYGRTSDYIVEMDVVLADGSTTTVVADTKDEPHRLYRELRPLLEGAREEAAAVFPSMNRGLTGYNLLQALKQDGKINLCKLLAGSEGTLAITTRIKLQVRRKPAAKGLVAVFYDDFQKALRHVPRLIEMGPLAVEIVDDKIMDLARSDQLWSRLEALFTDLPPGVRAVNFMEVVGETAAAIDEHVARIEHQLARDTSHVAARSVQDPALIASAWALRARGVGLLGALESDRKGVPFIEDTAVPPEVLADYVEKLRKILDRHGLTYGMFGHADVGCLHVRPALDMLHDGDRALIRTISDEVAALTKSFGGIIWGEHGRGIRGEYTPMFFGEQLYPVLRQIKTLFDPRNTFNPGKLVAPLSVTDPVLRIDQVPFRGQDDSAIPIDLRKAFGKAIACNGNGECHSWDSTDPMCPSYKATRDKVQSPNGRAALVRAWARNPSTVTEAAVIESFDSCLSCRACATSCPVKVDIPTMKSAFLSMHYQANKRPKRDVLIRHMEDGILYARKLPSLANVLLHNPVARQLMKCAGLVDIPRFKRNRSAAAQFQHADWRRIASLTKEAREQTVILLPDSFLSAFDPAPIIASAELLHSLGRTVLMGPVLANGKALEVRGFRSEYAAVREKFRKEVMRLSRTGIPLVAVEPSIVAQAHAEGLRQVQGIDQYLETVSFPPVKDDGREFKLVLHCTEKTADPAVAQRWKRIFQNSGLRLTVIEAGCCGMSGLFGHEAEHLDLSKRIYDLSWRSIVSLGDVAATGFSCRSQARRFGDRRLPHPIETLAIARGQIRVPLGDEHQ
ncbi:FAD-binding oxidoreductase [Ensifer sp. ENS05]|uniref:FAD-binding and (Fe-S)-binding domain-containing protein n=1 Tax=Ensifer sp. ENS05 TaxID=2769277 RepID=UPI00177ED1BB|nr:FAD-binding and (Fe-S)-binding domain-containing protein [Ensifer sp. ENS05]MBD9596918.1 FAD-binding oxidoreductase [Ensifer sp. ENS05]